MCYQWKFAQRMVRKVRGWSRRNAGQLTVVVEESLPDQLINPTEYEEDPCQ